MGKKELKISQVADNFEKQNTYRELCNRHTRAVKNEFFLEALLIDYAIMEDRLWAFLYYLGAFHDKDSEKISGKNREFIKALYKEKTNKNTIRIKNISVKMEVIDSLMNWCENNEAHPYGYQHWLKTVCDKKVDYVELHTLFKNIGEWCGYRNEIIHGALHKNIDELDKSAKKTELYGYQYARQLDNIVRRFRASNTIRKKMKMSLK